VRELSSLQVCTIGVYGFTEAGFFAALQRAGVDMFVDVRRRRGVRGHEYAFANSQRLQARLAELGIEYRYHQELSPSVTTRALQLAADRRQSIPQRARTTLSESFVATYQDECLAGLDAASFLAQLGPDTRTICLCCVEREPEACHRSLLASRFGAALGVDVEHLMP
jgi:uncharacterized protein (DUF488 family)